MAKLYRWKKDCNCKKLVAITAKQEPHFITFYFPEVITGTQVRADSKETAEAVHFVDESIGKLVSAVDSLHLNVNFIFL